MKILYIDESGCTGTLLYPDIQPLLIICGIIADSNDLYNITRELINIKVKYSPNRKAIHFLDNILWEIKGSELRKHIRDGGKRINRYTFWLVKEIIHLLQMNQIMLLGSVWVKERCKPLNEKSVYNLSIQKIASSFSHYLEEIGDNGLIVMDSRRVNQNILTSHSIFTEKYSFKRYKHAPIIESPLFGNSKNHALLQISDIIVSGVLFPLAIQAYCLELEDNIHVSRKYIEIAERFGRDVQNLQYRYIEQDIITNSINYRGGIYVVNKRGVDLFYPHA